MQTGVDWKSLTIPACLPITTDYFPDKRSLQNDYLVSDYNLLPDDVNADFAQNRAIYKKPLTTNEVFKELVSQRLAQVSDFSCLKGLNCTNFETTICPLYDFIVFTFTCYDLLAYARYSFCGLKEPYVYFQAILYTSMPNFVEIRSLVNFHPSKLIHL